MDIPLPEEIPLPSYGNDDNQPGPPGESPEPRRPKGRGNFSRPPRSQGPHMMHQPRPPSGMSGPRFRGPMPPYMRGPHPSQVANEKISRPASERYSPSRVTADDDEKEQPPSISAIFAQEENLIDESVPLQSAQQSISAIFDSYDSENQEQDQSSENMTLHHMPHPMYSRGGQHPLHGPRGNGPQRGSSGYRGSGPRGSRPPRNRGSQFGGGSRRPRGRGPRHRGGPHSHNYGGHQGNGSYPPHYGGSHSHYGSSHDGGPHSHYGGSHDGGSHPHYGGSYDSGSGPHQPPYGDSPGSGLYSHQYGGSHDSGPYSQQYSNSQDSGAHPPSYGNSYVSGPHHTPYGGSQGSEGYGGSQGSEPYGGSHGSVPYGSSQGSESHPPPYAGPPHPPDDSTPVSFFNQPPPPPQLTYNSAPVSAPSLTPSTQLPSNTTDTTVQPTERPSTGSPKLDKLPSSPNIDSSWPNVSEIFKSVISQEKNNFQKADDETVDAADTTKSEQESSTVNEKSDASTLLNPEESSLKDPSTSEESEIMIPGTEKIVDNKSSASPEKPSPSSTATPTEKSTESASTDESKIAEYVALAASLSSHMNSEVEAKSNTKTVLDNTGTDGTAGTDKPLKKAMPKVLGKQGAKKRLLSYSGKLSTFSLAKTTKPTITAKLGDDDDPNEKKKVVQVKKKKKEEKISSIEQIKNEESRLKEALGLQNVLFSPYGPGLAPIAKFLDNPEELEKFTFRGKQAKIKKEEYDKRSKIREMEEERRIEREKERRQKDRENREKERKKENKTEKESKTEENESKKEESKSDSKTVEEKKKSTVLPKTWRDFKAENFSLESLRNVIKEDQRRRRSRSRDRGRSYSNSGRDKKENKQLAPVKLRSINGMSLQYPANMVQYTKCEPTISYGINHLKYQAHYATRSEIKMKEPSEIWNLMQDLWSAKPHYPHRKKHGKGKICRDWYAETLALKSEGKGKAETGDKEEKEANLILDSVPKRTLDRHVINPDSKKELKDNSKVDQEDEKAATKSRWDSDNEEKEDDFDFVENVHDESFKENQSKVSEKTPKHADKEEGRVIPGEPFEKELKEEYEAFMEILGGGSETIEDKVEEKMALVSQEGENLESEDKKEMAEEGGLYDDLEDGKDKELESKLLDAIFEKDQGIKEPEEKVNDEKKKTKAEKKLKKQLKKAKKKEKKEKKAKKKAKKKTKKADKKKKESKKEKEGKKVDKDDVDPNLGNESDNSVVHLKDESVERSSRKERKLSERSGKDLSEERPKEHSDRRRDTDERSSVDRERRRKESPNRRDEKEYDRRRDFDHRRDGRGNFRGRGSDWRRDGFGGRFRGRGGYERRGRGFGKNVPLMRDLHRGKGIDDETKEDFEVHWEFIREKRCERKEAIEEGRDLRKERQEKSSDLQRRRRDSKGVKYDGNSSDSNRSRSPARTISDESDDEKDWFPYDEEIEELDKEGNVIKGPNRKNALDVDESNTSLSWKSRDSSPSRSNEDFTANDDKSTASRYPYSDTSGYFDLSSAPSPTSETGSGHLEEIKPGSQKNIKDNENLGIELDDIPYPSEGPTEFSSRKDYPSVDRYSPSNMSMSASPPSPATFDSPRCKSPPLQIPLPPLPDIPVPPVTSSHVKNVKAISLPTDTIPLPSLPGGKKLAPVAEKMQGASIAVQSPLVAPKTILPDNTEPIPLPSQIPTLSHSNESLISPITKEKLVSSKYESPLQYQDSSFNKEKLVSSKYESPLQYQDSSFNKEKLVSSKYDSPLQYQDSSIPSKNSLFSYDPAATVSESSEAMSESGQNPTKWVEKAADGSHIEDPSDKAKSSRSMPITFRLGGSKQATIKRIQKSSVLAGFGHDEEEEAKIGFDLDRSLDDGKAEYGNEEGREEENSSSMVTSQIDDSHESGPCMSPKAVESSNIDLQLEHPDETEIFNRIRLKSLSPEKDHPIRSSRSPQRSQARSHKDASPFRSQSPGKIKSPKSTRSHRRSKSPHRNRSPDRSRSPQRNRSPKRTRSPKRSRDSRSRSHSPRRMGSRRSPPRKRKASPEHKRFRGSPERGRKREFGSPHRTGRSSREGRSPPLRSSAVRSGKERRSPRRFSRSPSPLKGGRYVSPDTIRSRSPEKFPSQGTQGPRTPEPPDKEMARLPSEHIGSPPRDKEFHSNYKDKLKSRSPDRPSSPVLAGRRSIHSPQGSRITRKEYRSSLSPGSRSPERWASRPHSPAPRKQNWSPKRIRSRSPGWRSPRFRSPDRVKYSPGREKISPSRRRSPLRSRSPRRSPIRKSPGRRPLISTRSPIRRSKSRSPIGRSSSRSPIRRSPLRRSPRWSRSPLRTRSPIRRSPGRRSPGRRSPLRRSPGRRSPLRRSPLRRSPLRRSPLRRSPLRRSPSRRSPLRKSPLRKSPRRSPLTSPIRKSPLRKFTRSSHSPGRDYDYERDQWNESKWDENQEITKKEHERWTGRSPSPKEDDIHEKYKKKDGKEGTLKIDADSTISDSELTIKKEPVESSPSPPSSPQRLSLDERLQREHGLELEDPAKKQQQQQSQQASLYNWGYQAHPVQVHQFQYAYEGSEGGATEGGTGENSSRVIQVGNMLQVLPQDPGTTIVQAGNVIQVVPAENMQMLGTDVSSGLPVSSNGAGMGGVVQVVAGGMMGVPGSSPTPVPAPSTSAVTAASGKSVPDDPIAAVSSMLSSLSSIQLPGASVLSPLSISQLANAASGPPVTTQATNSVTATTSTHAAGLPVAHLISLLQQQQQMASMSESTVDQEAKAAAKEKEKELKRERKEKRRKEREARREARQKEKAALAKQAEAALEAQKKEDSDTEDETLIREAIYEVPNIGSPVPEYEIMPDEDEDEDEEEALLKKKRRLPIPLPPPEKGILMSPSFRYRREEYNPKAVKFADGIMPGEGTSPSGGEEVQSPPPPTGEAKPPKEKKLRKKRKTKVKMIKEYMGNDGESVSQPPPPPSQPPLAALKLHPGYTHYSYSKPGTVVIYAQQQHQQAAAYASYAAGHPQGAVAVPGGMVIQPGASAQPQQAAALGGVLPGGFRYPGYVYTTVYPGGQQLQYVLPSSMTPQPSTSTSSPSSQKTSRKNK